MAILAGVTSQPSRSRLAWPHYEQAGNKVVGALREQKQSNCEAAQVEVDPEMP